MKFVLTRFMPFAAALFLMSAASTALAQSWDFTISDEQGQASGTVELTVTIAHVGDEEAWAADFQVGDLTAFSNVDFSRCTENFPDAFIETCGFRAAPNDDIIRIQWSSNVAGEGWPAEVTAPIEFTIDGGATPGTIIPMTWDAFNVNGTVESTDGQIEVVDVSAVLNVQPPSIDFGGVETSSSSSAEVVTISNDGSDGIDLEVSDVSLADGTHFSFDMGTCGATPFTLADGDSCEVNAFFEPAADGAQSDTLTVTSDAGTVTNDSVALDGEGTLGPAGSLSISPASHSFGQLLTSQESDTQTFTVTSDGNAGSEVSINAVNLTGDTAHFSIASENCNGNTLPEGDTCSVTAEFAPTADGVWNATLEVSGEDGNGDTRADTAAMDGEGVSESRFSSDPAAGGTVNMGTTQLGGTLSEEVVITNDGNAGLDVTCGSLDDPSGNFSLDPDPADFTGIAPGAEDSFTVSCEVPEQGSFTASLTCETNEDGTPTYDYEFTCAARPLVIPTMQTWGLMLFALMMLIIGGFSIRFFRAG